MATLRELLSTPYVITVTAVPNGTDGQSTRRAELTEIPECYVEDISPWDALDALEQMLPRFVIDAVLAGRPVPSPRPPLRDIRVERLLAERGLQAWVPFLDTDVATLRTEPGVRSIMNPVPSTTDDAR